MSEITTEIIKIIIIPLLASLGAYLITYIRSKRNALLAETDNDIYEKYITLISDTIIDCVSNTNQTLVDTLKKQEKFDKAAQKEAFDLTYQTVISLLSEDAKVYIEEIFGDLESYLVTKIEATVRQLKSSNE